MVILAALSLKLHVLLAHLNLVVLSLDKFEFVEHSRRWLINPIQILLLAFKKLLFLLTCHLSSALLNQKLLKLSKHRS